MALLSILFGRLPGLSIKVIGILPIDAFTQETITLSSEVTDHPVETGGVVTDHIKNNPVGLRVTGVVRASRRGLAFNILTALHERRAPVAVVTGLQTFQRMAITHLEIPREARTASSFQFTAEFKQITFVESEISDAPAQDNAADTASSTKSTGNKTTVPASPDSASAASEAQDATGGPPEGSRGSILSQLFGVS